MAGTTRGAARIKPIYLLIALLPALVFLFNQFLLNTYAAPWDVLPERIAVFDPHREGAARITMLAGFLLFMGAAAAAFLFFLYTLLMLEWDQRFVLFLAAIALALAAVVAQKISDAADATDFMGKSLTCLAAGYDKTASDSAERNGWIATARQKEAEAAANESLARELGTELERKAATRTLRVAERERKAIENGARPSESSSRPPVVGLSPSPQTIAQADLGKSSADLCRTPRFVSLKRLMLAQFVAMALAFAGLVFGALCCLAEPGSKATLDDLEHQSAWLNTYLYLAALLLGAGLLFVNAYLRWPSFVLAERQNFDSYVASMLAYYGFTFTVMLAAFYIPVATILADRVRNAAGGKGELPQAFKGPMQVLKIVLGLVAPTLVGYLPNLFGFGS